jgi:hypothetical protein
MRDQILGRSEKNSEFNTEEASSIDDHLWSKIIEPLIIPVWVIIKIRQTKNGSLYQEVASEKGNWEDLAFVLWQDFGQFKDRVLPHLSRRNRDLEIEKIGIELERIQTPYPFYLPDFTDDMYCGFVINAKTRVFQDGTTA